ncbi:MAG TPA: HlyC/CorC family transporter [Leucothrix sp.]|nr:HlyC/CorC family transporter [Leucothrix sp.]
MNSIPIGWLFFTLLIFFLLSAFFSGTETALMALNRYKLKHLARKNRGAKLAMQLLEKPDRLIGVILLGNNLVNILITQLATLIGLRLGGNVGVAIATGVLTLMLLIFAEVTPKTIAALKAEKIALPASYIYVHLLKVAYPLVWIINLVANSLVRMVGIDPTDNTLQSLNHEELKSVVNEAGGLIPQNHQEMLLRVLDMESITVDDIMIPRPEISGIDLNDDWNDIEEHILRSNFTRMIVYKGGINDVQGFLHLRSLMPLFHDDKMERQLFENAIVPAYFTPEGVPLTQQLINFQEAKQRMALVVDEYGDVQGLVTIEDILEEIVGEFSTSPANFDYEARIHQDGSIWVDGAMHIRDLNRQLKMKLPTNHSKTINGLVTEHLGQIPVPGVSILINNYPMEIRKTFNNAVKTLIIYPEIKR